MTYLHFCLEFFCYVEKRLDKKARVSFKIYDVTDWKTDNYNTYVVIVSSLSGVVILIKTCIDFFDTPRKLGDSI